jgi:hypothetical protein
MGIGICCINSPVTEESNLNEMRNGIIPNIDNLQEKNNNIDLKMSSSYNFVNKNNKKETIDSDYINSDQQKSEQIFLFFNNLRNNPLNYLSEAEKYNLSEIISTANEKSKKNNFTNLIKNPFYDLFFDKCVKTSPESEENILNNIEKENLFKNYEKKLYIIEGNTDNVEECIWQLIKKCYDNGDEILTKKIDYLVLTTITSDDNTKFFGYFLFLSTIKENDI